MADRDDSVLNTGLSSAAFRRQVARREAEAEVKQSKRSLLTPGAEIIIKWIDNEIEKVADLREMILNVSDKDLLRDQLLAKQHHLAFLKDLKAKAKNILREVKQQEFEDE